MFAIDELLRNALREDIASGDVTTRVTVDAATSAQGELLAKEEFLLAGLDVARRVFHLVDEEIRFESGFRDGMAIARGEVFALVSGRAVSLLQGERVALNFVQRLSGVATLTRQFVKAVEGTRAAIVDTRKTTPGLRFLEKYAVRVGGGRNHRFSLADGILIKENHSRAAGGIAAAVGRAKRMAPHPLRVEVEVSTLDEAAEALAAGADILLLDNMEAETVRQAVAFVAGRALLEVSGGVSLATVRSLAECGVDFISVGALTHSSRAVDISLLFDTSFP
ncbi:MAG: carboxylating nicotinate-nucleotide diphosphorylase [Desulfuromonadaceae bacterium]|nr:carboxylating nicotinate-nucleotide diphosphorylase [Desulfuromonadaceae bacterium]